MTFSKKKQKRKYEITDDVHRLVETFLTAKTKQCSLQILQGFFSLWTSVNKLIYFWLSLPIRKIITFKHSRIENGNVQIKRMYETMINNHEQAPGSSAPK